MPKKTLLTRPDLTRATVYFEMSCAAARAHWRIAGMALTLYGNHGAQISGCMREHFPEPIKETLRSLARTASEYSRQAHASRPKGVRMLTMWRLGKAIAARDGSGFYGPQA